MIRRSVIGEELDGYNGTQTNLTRVLFVVQVCGGPASGLYKVAYSVHGRA
jgi:hypothetical protein